MGRVLITDDSSFQRKWIKTVLSPTGHELLEAAGGQQCLELLSSTRVDCLLLDLLMPDTTGAEVLEVLRSKGISVPTVVLTADIQETTRQKCRELGVRWFLHKPFRDAELLDAVRQAVASGSEIG